MNRPTNEVDGRTKFMDEWMDGQRDEVDGPTKC